MKKRALHKDFYIELKKTWTRFLSILLIVALGVAFFSGLRACKRDMLLSVDEFYDQTGFMDLTVYGTYGLTKEDITALSELPEIETAEGAYTKDVFVKMESQNIVVRTFSLTSSTNQYEIIEGRTPNSVNECMVDRLFLKNTGCHVGDKIKLSLEDEELTETLNEVELTIVGSCDSPSYMAFSRGTSDIGSGSINSFIVLTDAAYKSDVYSMAYCIAKGTKELEAYSDAYDEKRDQAKEAVEALAASRCDARYDEIIKEPREELSKKREEYESSLSEFTKQKEEAQAGFDKTEEELLTAKAAVEAITASIAEKKEKLYAISYGEDDIDRMLAPYIEEEKQAKQQYNESLQAYLSQKDELNRQFEITEQELKVADDELTVQEAKLKEVKSPEWMVTTREFIDSYTSYRSDADRIDAIGRVFPAIFFFVAALVCLTTMTRMVDEQRSQIGLLKALGYKNIDIAGKFLKYAFSATLLGSLIGALIGQKIFPNVVINAYRIMYGALPKILSPYYLEPIILAGVLAILCTMIATYMAAVKDLQAQPSELMRPAAPKSGKRILLEHLPFLWNHLNFTKKSTLRNLFRYKKRFFMTTIGIAGCMALLLVGFGLKDSIGVMSELQYEELWLQDSELALDTALTGAEKEAFKTDLLEDSRITDAALVYQKEVDFTSAQKKKTGNILVLKDKNVFEKFLVFRNRETKKKVDFDDSGVIVTEKLAKMLAVKPGDSIIIQLDSEHAVPVKVTGVSENYLFHYVFMTESLYQTLMETHPDYTGCYIKTTCQSLSEEDALYESLLSEFSQIRYISSTRSLNNRIHDMLKSLNIITYVLIVCAGLLAFIVLYNLSNININERKRELASLKVLGFYDGEVNSYVMRENLILTLFGIAFGLVLGHYLHRFVITTCEIDLVMFGRLIRQISYVYSTGLTLLFSLFICFLMYFKLKKIDMIESLKSVE